MRLRRISLLGVLGLIVFGVIVILAILYMYFMSKLNKLDSNVRNRAGDVDTLIWDRNHIYTQITKYLQEKDITLDEELTKPLSLSIGMPVSLQMATCTELFRRWKKIQPILEEHPEFKEDPEFAKLLERFNSIRTDLITSGSSYNIAATEFNAYIDKGFPGILAGRKGKAARTHFNYELAEVSVNENSRS